MGVFAVGPAHNFCVCSACQGFFLAWGLYPCMFINLVAFLHVCNFCQPTSLKRNYFKTLSMYVFDCKPTGRTLFFSESCGHVFTARTKHPLFGNTSTVCRM